MPYELELSYSKLVLASCREDPIFSLPVFKCTAAPNLSPATHFHLACHARYPISLTPFEAKFSEVDRETLVLRYLPVWLASPALNGRDRLTFSPSSIPSFRLSKCPVQRKRSVNREILLGLRSLHPSCQLSIRPSRNKNPPNRPSTLPFTSCEPPLRCHLEVNISRLIQLSCRTWMTISSTVIIFNKWILDTAGFRKF